jgi:hypothetical protein
VRVFSNFGWVSAIFHGHLVEGFSTSGTGTCIALMQLGVAFELETPKFIDRQIFMLFFIN